MVHSSFGHLSLRAEIVCWRSDSSMVEKRGSHLRSKAPMGASLQQGEHAATNEKRSRTHSIGSSRNPSRTEWQYLDRLADAEIAAVASDPDAARMMSIGPRRPLSFAPRRRQSRSVSIQMCSTISKKTVQATSGASTQYFVHTLSGSRNAASLLDD